MSVLPSAAGALGQRLRMQRIAQVDEVHPGLRELPLGVQLLEHHVRVGQLHQHRSGLDLRARPQRDPLHAARGVRGDQTDLLGNQRPRAFDLAQHRAALHRVRPEAGAVHDGRRRSQPGKAERDRRQRRRDADANDQVALPRVPRFARNVHHARARFHPGDLWLHRMIHLSEVRAKPLQRGITALRDRGGERSSHFRTDALLRPQGHRGVQP